MCESGYTGYEQFYDGAARILFWTENHPYVFYSIGEEIDVAERAKFYSDYSMKDTAMGLFKLQSKQQINFEQLAFSYFDESYGVSETDWYNAVLASLDNTDTVATSYNFNILNDLFGWFEYDMTFEPGQTINQRSRRTSLSGYRRQICADGVPFYISRVACIDVGGI